MEIEINKRKIGANHRPYIICELSGNHNGSLDRALKLVDAASETGCDAIKIQSYRAENLTLKSDNPEFKISGGLWDGYTLYDLYKEAATPYDWHPALFERAREKGVTIFSTPFDEIAVDMLEKLDAPAYKVASFEITDIPLIKCIARTKKPMIMSTGLANLAEIEAAVLAAKGEGCTDLVVLHCISSYPAPIEQSNLATIKNLSDTFNVVGGLSDHTLGATASIAAVALGASVIEKHFTLARADGGPDSDFSLEPEEFSHLVRECRSAWDAIGTINYQIKSAEEKNKSFRRSLYAVKEIEQGAELTAENVKSIRPGFGMSPAMLPSILGKTAKRPIKYAEPISIDMFE